MAETVAVVHRVLASGSSFPSLVQTVQGRRYVLKLAGAGPGRRALATEYVAIALARHLGLDVPEAHVLDLPHDLPWQAGTDEFYETLQRSPGPNLGVAFIPDARDLKAAELPTLPREFLSRLAAVDALLQNVDRTTVNPNIMRDEAGTCWAIDFGACLLIERIARGSAVARLHLPRNHFLAGEAALSYSVRAAAETIGSSRLEAIIEGIPEPWLDDLALARPELLLRLQAYLDAVRRP